MFSIETLQAAHMHCAGHRGELLASDVCGCFDCRQTYPPSEIEHWIEETRGELAQRSDPWTARCPRCGTDSVLGSASGLPVSDPIFLRAMHDHWSS